MAEEVKTQETAETNTPSKADKAVKAKKNAGPSFGSKVKTYFRSLKAELHKITWESPKDVCRNTLLVLVCMIIVAAVIALLDFLFQHSLSGLIALIK